MKKKSGFTLVELIVGMAVTMVALAAAVLMFRDSTKANRHSHRRYFHPQHHQRVRLQRWPTS